MTENARPTQWQDGTAVVQALRNFTATWVGDDLVGGDYSAETTPAFDDAYVIRICALADTYIAIGTTPVASTTGEFFPEGHVEYKNIKPGDKVAVTWSANIIVQA